MSRPKITFQFGWEERMDDWDYTPEKHVFFVTDEENVTTSYIAPGVLKNVSCDYDIDINYDLMISIVDDFVDGKDVTGGIIELMQTKPVFIPKKTFDVEAAYIADIECRALASLPKDTILVDPSRATLLRAIEGKKDINIFISDAQTEEYRKDLSETCKLYAVQPDVYEKIPDNSVVYFGMNAHRYTQHIFRNSYWAGFVPDVDAMLSKTCKIINISDEGYEYYVKSKIKAATYINYADPRLRIAAATSDVDSDPLYLYVASRKLSNPFGRLLRPVYLPDEMSFLSLSSFRWWCSLDDVFWCNPTFDRGDLQGQCPHTEFNNQLCDDCRFLFKYSDTGTQVLTTSGVAVSCPINEPTFCKRVNDGERDIFVPILLKTRLIFESQRWKWGHFFDEFYRDKVMAMELPTWYFGAIPENLPALVIGSTSSLVAIVGVTYARYDIQMEMDCVSKIMAKFGLVAAAGSEIQRNSRNYDEIARLFRMNSMMIEEFGSACYYETPDRDPEMLLGKIARHDEKGQWIEIPESGVGPRSRYVVRSNGKVYTKIYGIDSIPYEVMSHALYLPPVSLSDKFDAKELFDHDLGEVEVTSSHHYTIDNV